MAVEPTSSATDSVGDGPVLHDQEPLPLHLQAQLCVAVNGGKVEAVRKLLVEENADPLAPADDDLTRPPVYLAAVKGHADVLKLMLEQNANANTARINNGVSTQMFVCL